MALQCTDLGIDYPFFSWLRLQDIYWERRAAGGAQDRIFFTEHEPVYTSGARSARNRRLLEKCFKKPVPELPCACIDTQRGGLATYQGPGILSVYCILNLNGQSPAGLNEMLLTSAQKALKKFGIAALRSRKNPGLYLGSDKKIVSVGWQMSRGVSRYGMAVSIDPEEKYLEPLIPCGLEGVRLTSLQQETRRDITDAEKNLIKENIYALLVKERGMIL